MSADDFITLAQDLGGWFVSILTTIGTVVAMFVVWRRRQLSRPKIEIDFGDESAQEGAPTKAIARTKVGILAFANTSREQSLQVLVLLAGITNKGKGSATNVRVVITYDASFALNHDEFSDLLKVENAMAIFKEDKEKITVGKLHKISTRDLDKILDRRSSSIYRGTAQLSIEIPIIREGETAPVWEIFRTLGKLAYTDNGDAHTKSGFQNLAQHLSSLAGINAAFSVKMSVYAENHRPISRSLVVLFLDKSREVEHTLADLQKGRGFWFGGSLQPGKYLSEPLSLWLGRKFGVTGRLSTSFEKKELGILVYPKFARGTLRDGSDVEIQIPDYSTQQSFQLGTPNCDLHNLPIHVDSFERLTRWLLIGRPIFRHKTRPLDKVD